MVGMRIKRAVTRRLTRSLPHPDGRRGPELPLRHDLRPTRGRAPSTAGNVCVFADGEVDRSPTGTGVSGRAAVHVARGELALGETIRIESLIGTAFDVTATERVRVGTGAGAVDGIVPRVRGSAHVTGRHEFLLDPADPLIGGVLLR